MHRHERADARLRAFAEAVGAAIDLPAELGHLLVLAVAAVPSCIGVSLVFAGGLTPALTVSALPVGAPTVPVLASLGLRLPRPPPPSTRGCGRDLVSSRRDD